MALSTVDIMSLLKDTVEFTYDRFSGKVNYIDQISRLIFTDGYVGPTTVIGRTSPCNHIYISLTAFYNYCIDRKIDSPDVVRNKAFEVIMHEMTHADQLIDPKFLAKNASYRDSIEKDCIYQTARYVLDNLNIIRSYGLYVDESSFRNMIHTVGEREFGRKNPSLFVPYRLENIIGPKFKDIKSYNTVLNYYGNKVLIKDRGLYVSSLEQIDYLERMHINRNFNMEFLFDGSDLEIKITQGT